MLENGQQYKFDKKSPNFKNTIKLPNTDEYIFSKMSELLIFQNVAENALSLSLDYLDIFPFLTKNRFMQKQFYKQRMTF